MRKSWHRGDAKMQRQSAIHFERVSWDDLRLFASAAGHQSFRQAAFALKTASSTVTRRIERLETELGVRLFDRVPEGVVLTADGRQVLAAVQEMTRASLGVRAALDRDTASRGLIRCAVTEGIGTFWLLPKLGEYHARSPYTIVDLRCAMDSADLLRLEADVSIQLVQPTNPDLLVRRLGYLHIYPFAARSYIEKHGAPGNPLELFQHRIVDQTSPQFADGVLQGYLGAVDLEGVVSVRTNASTAHFYAVELGIGIGGLPTYAIPLGADVIPLDIGLHHRVDVWLAYHPEVRRVQRVVDFIDWLIEQFDPIRFPWFREEFIHPNAFDGFGPDERDLRFDGVDRLVADLRVNEPRQTRSGGQGAHEAQNGNRAETKST